MNLKHLETFHHFCRFMSVSRAAEFLHVTQPAVSQQLSLFQSECGATLFYREGNDFRLTETGEEVFLLTKRIFSRVNQIESLLERAGKPDAMKLRIGTTKTYARTVMPDLIGRFQEKHPHIAVHLSEGNSADLIKRLTDRREDVVVVARRQYDSSLKSVPFARCEFVLVTRPDHPLVNKAPVSVQALNGEPMIIRERGSGSREAILEKLGRFGVTTSLLVESESLSFILAYLQRRTWISFMLSHEIEKELSSGILKQIELLEGNINFNSDIVVRRNEPLSTPMKSFLKMARAHAMLVFGETA